MVAMKNWKPNARQRQILAVLEKAEKVMTPSEIGEACGQAKGAPAAKWCYHAVKGLIKKGMVEKAGVGQYHIGPKKED